MISISLRTAVEPDHHWIPYVMFPLMILHNPTTTYTAIKHLRISITEYVRRYVCSMRLCIEIKPDCSYVPAVVSLTLPFLLVQS